MVNRVEEKVFLVGHETDKLMVRREYSDFVSEEAFCDGFQSLLNAAMRFREEVYPKSCASSENGEGSFFGFSEEEEFEIYGLGAVGTGEDG